MTLQSICGQLESAGKPAHLKTVHNYLRTLKIKPLGARQRPQNYPADSAARILQHLGLAPIVRARNNGTAWKTPRAKLPTMSQLRAERQKARGGK